MSVESTQWKNYSAVPTHHIFGRQYKFGIRSMQLITRNYILHVVQEIKEKKMKNHRRTPHLARSIVDMV